jgi:hypothetical protein
MKNLLREVCKTLVLAWMMKEEGRSVSCMCSGWLQEFLKIIQEAKVRRFISLQDVRNH